MPVGRVVCELVCFFGAHEGVLGDAGVAEEVADAVVDEEAGSRVL